MQDFLISKKSATADCNGPTKEEVC